MKKALFLSLLASSLAVALLFTGCEGWTSNDAGFNSSEGAGATINFSGFYQGTGGGLAVKNTSAGNIVSLTIQQAGDTVEIHDNQGSTYRGKIGSPGAVSASSGGSFPVGAELAQAEINFSGHDNVAGKDITFAGVIHAVAVADIKGTTTSDTSTTTDNSTRTRTTNNVGTATTTSTHTTNGTTVQVSVLVGPITTTTITTTTVDATGQVLSRTVTTTANDNNTTTDNNTETTTATTTYTLTEANSQYRLQGTWVEDGGGTAQVDALSSGTSGLITTTTTATAPTTP